ncbi:Uncharacterised protein [BD1-7 clade bacterium]|uniref:Uncharacterized protein n=1 Tax=BD1-7 clade bacterium TaxID=2029982 RepID=A0A5S9PK99_9GAMM|nr:Uncharacterised protein [BD1-7 clade bacterium]CAA0104458.1 Uncharacterised protein [BD1-7 clade bacterium]
MCVNTRDESSDGLMRARNHLDASNIYVNVSVQEMIPPRYSEAC